MAKTLAFQGLKPYQLTSIRHEKTALVANRERDVTGDRAYNSAVK